MPFINKIIKKFLKKRGFLIVPKEQFNAMKDIYLFMVNQETDISVDQELMGVVFSKDRAMQLHAFLTSYFEQISNPAPIVILYKASDERHQRSYQQLSSLFSHKRIKFIEESSFRTQLIDIIAGSSCKNVLFFVDDMIFTHSFDFSILEQIDASKYIVALSRGMDMNYSAVLQKKLQLPHFDSDVIKGMICFKWSEIEKFSDWTYSLGVSGYMYRKNEILNIFKTIDFKAPNSLEGEMQLYYQLFISRFGLCTTNAISVCVHANIVQTEGYNPVLGTYSIEELLEKWESGMCIDCQDFYNKPMNVTQIKRYSFIERTNKI